MQDYPLLILNEPFKSLWKGKDPFAETAKLTGDVTREVETRKTLRFEVDGKGYYVKSHYGTTVKEILKNLFSFRLPVLGADREWAAIHHLNSHGVKSMTGVAYGQKNFNPLTRESFIVTEEVTSSVDLHNYFSKDKKYKFRDRIAIIEHVAGMVRGMHACGINHRDCYMYHFLLKVPYDSTAGEPDICIIDLHRSQIRNRVPRRWRDKDLIGLYFSCLNLDISKSDIMRFAKIYWQTGLREIFKTESALIGKIDKEAQKIKERSRRKGYV